jgi:hypothetical protein
MTEPDVTLTDYGLALECAARSWLISRRRGPRPLRFWVLLVFASVGLAALLYHLLQAIGLLMIFVGVGWFAAHRTPA